MAVKKITDKSFEELTLHELSNTSLLNLFNILQDTEKNYFLNIFKAYTFNQDLIKDVVYYNTYTMDDPSWFDTASYNTYNNSKLWWFICMTNKVLNPFEEGEPGKNLKVLKSLVLPTIIRELKVIANK